MSFLLRDFGIQMRRMHCWKTRAVRASTTIIEKSRELSDKEEDADGERGGKGSRDSARGSKPGASRMRPLYAQALSLYSLSMHAPKRASSPFVLCRHLPSNVPRPSGPFRRPSVRLKKSSLESFCQLFCIAVPNRILHLRCRK